MKVKESEQLIIKNALRCYRDREVSMGNDVRDIQDMIEKISLEVKEVNTPPKEPPRVPSAKEEYIRKIVGDDKKRVESKENQG